MRGKNILGIFTLIIIGVVFSSGCVQQGGTASPEGKYTGQVTGGSGASPQTEGLITKNPEDMLPKMNDLPTEFEIEEVGDVNVDASGFVSGSSVSATKLVGRVVLGLILVDFKVFKFNSAENTEAFYNQEVNEIKNLGGYTQISVPVSGCFAWTEDYGFDASFATANCHKTNIVYQVAVTGTQTYEKVDKYLSQMTNILTNKIQ